MLLQRQSMQKREAYQAQTNVKDNLEYLKKVKQEMAKKRMIMLSGKKPKQVNIEDKI